MRICLSCGRRLEEPRNQPLIAKFSGQPLQPTPLLGSIMIIVVVATRLLIRQLFGRAFNSSRAEREGRYMMQSRQLQRLAAAATSAEHEHGQWRDRQRRARQNRALVMQVMRLQRLV